MSQNIFDYATSELSQDAFISLLVGWFDSQDQQLKDLSTSFVQELYKLYHTQLQNKNMPSLNIHSIQIKQQHHKIDVYFEVTLTNGKVIPFIIEDKTWTEPHSGQLERYANKIKNENTIKIFFKTGHITEKDRNETALANYMIIDAKWIYDFLIKNAQNVEHIILQSYIEYLKVNFYLKLYDDTTGKKLELCNWKEVDLKEGYVQYALIENIKTQVVRDIESDQSKNYIKYMRNGKRWDTWWSFAKVKDKCDFFVKVKKIGTKHRIRLIEYSNKNFDPEDKKNSYKDTLERITKNTDIRVTEKPRNKAREMEIAFIDIDDTKSLENYSKSFSTFMQDFIRELKKT